MASQKGNTMNEQATPTGTPKTGFEYFIEVVGQVLYGIGLMFAIGGLIFMVFLIDLKAKGGIIFASNDSRIIEIVEPQWDDAMHLAQSNTNKASGVRYSIKFGKGK
jgi:hypothetical protein